MRELFLAANSDSADWLIFLGMLLLICLGIGIFVVWFTIFRNKGKKRRKRHHHRHRHHPGSPLSARGGLPPRREPPDKSPPSAL